VLRFEQRKLLDVSSQFQWHFDRLIKQARGQLDSKQLSELKNSDGRLSEEGSLSVEEMHQLQLTKIRVLEIVWSYLYSGRQEQAWHAPLDMWPGSDVERIRAILLNAWSSGIGRQLDGLGPRAEIPLSI
jgi:hypothetical protein